MKYTYYIILAMLLLCSCSEERDIDNGVQRLSITFADAPTQSRSYWTDFTDTEDKKVSYVWEDGTNMLTAIKHGTQYVPFYDDLAGTPQYHTNTKFETVDAGKSKIRLQTECGVKYDEVAGAYAYPVAAGDEMYCCHPINAHTDVMSSADAVTVDMHLPQTFTYAALSNDLQSLEEYSYVYTSTTLQSVNATDVVANTSSFNSACAIIRFNITNNVSTAIDITGIKMESNDGSKIFPDVLRFSDGSVAEQADKEGYYSRLTTTINSVTIPKNSTGTFYNLCFPLNGNFNNVPLKFTIDTNYLTYQLKLATDKITNNKFEAGKIYTFNFDLKEKEINLNTIEIAQCTTYNIDNTESLNVIINGDAIWQQSDDATAQMVFVSLAMSTTINGIDYDVLWATCNLGAMEPIETGFHYAWGEVATKDSNQYSPTGYTGKANTDIMGTSADAVKVYLGGGYWLWCTPTKDMWDKLLDTDEYGWSWQTVKKVSDGGESEENLNFDASVWEVTKRDSEGKLIGHIYLPITGYSGLLDAPADTYGRVNKARCQYWTSTPCSNVAGATEKSYAFQTIYSTEIGTGKGSMSAPKLEACDRYNGYAIRPVLLKKK